MIGPKNAMSPLAFACLTKASNGEMQARGAAAILRSDAVCATFNFGAARTDLDPNALGAGLGWSDVYASGVIPAQTGARRLGGCAGLRRPLDP